MSTEFDAYIRRNPGDLWTAEDFVEVQRRIKADIAGQIKEAVDKLHKVPESDTAHKLDNQTSDELSEAILERARQELPKRTGYQRIFKRLREGEESVVKHDLGGCPLTDIYHLDPFDVVCSEDDQKNQESVFFFLYHSSERRIRFTPVGQQAAPGPGVEIEPTGGTPFRIAFADLLAYYHVRYTDSSTLDDLETEFWEAFSADPNDDFDDDQYCHSPWFDRCCGERRTVADLKSRGDWDELWLKMKPRKTINTLQRTGEGVDMAPHDIQVVHFDFNKLGITYLSGARFLEAGGVVEKADAEIQRVRAGGDVQNVMVLLKV